MKANSTGKQAQHAPALGVVVAGLGAAVAVTIYLQPEQLAAPFWIAMLACLAVVLAGAALATPQQRYPRLHQCLILALLLVFTVIPAWISFGPGERQCSSNVPFLNDATSCRVVFGFSTACMLTVLTIAGKQLWRLLRQPQPAEESSPTAIKNNTA